MIKIPNRIWRLITCVFVFYCGISQKIDAQAISNAIDTSLYVTIGGIKQYIKVKGNNVENPILLYLHGGPGAAVSNHADKVTALLETDFTVVHWDQRGSGKTKANTPQAESITLEVMQNDASEMLQYLLNTYHKKKIYLVGNSWGSMLGFYLAANYPKQIQAYFAVSPVINNLKSQQLLKDSLVQYFKNKKEALEELEEIKIPHQSAEDITLLYKWQSAMEGYTMNTQEYEGLLEYFKIWEKQWMPLFKELYGIDVTQQFNNLECPVYIMAGKQDVTANFKLTEDYYKFLKAPKKNMFVFDTAGHNIPQTKAVEMQQLIIAHQ